MKAWIASIPRIDVFVPNVSALSDEWEDVLQRTLVQRSMPLHWFTQIA
ncbi:hypothetical protein O9929_17540 [Vibrio lentus]|nr:hypothetical protein [Vibrio lentus]